MAVTTTYSFEPIDDLNALNITDEAAITSLANGGFAVVGTHSGHTDGTIFNANAAQTESWNFTDGTNAAVAQLSNGNLVIASQDADSILYKIVDGTTGSTVVNTVDIGDTNSSNADVAALAGGGFVIVNQDVSLLDPADVAIDARIYDNGGNLIATIEVAGFDNTDHDPKIAALTGGGFAVVWTRTVGSETEIWRAVYDAAGAIVLAPTLVDTAGTINQNVSITATSNGGFAIAYEDNGWGTGEPEISLGQFDQSGAWVRLDNVSNDSGSADANPYVTTLSNGMLVVAYSNNTFGDTDTYIKLVDPATGNILATRNILAGENVFDDVENAVAAGFGSGGLAVFRTNVTDGDIDGEALQAVRTSTGDGANDTIVGDSLVDVMYGGGGIDTLTGAAGNDELYGGTGNDALYGGAGNDVLYGGFGTDTVNGGNGNDHIIVLNDEYGDDVNGGGGVDTYDLSDLADYYVAVDLGAGTSQIYTDLGVAYGPQNSMTNVEDVFGGALNDAITGNDAGNFLKGGGGSDVLYGGVGSDTLYGGSGSDTLGGGFGADTLNGGADDDAINGGNGNDTLIGGAGADALNGGGGSDTASYASSNSGVTANLGNAAANTGDAAGDSYASIENLYGSNHADNLVGDGTANALTGAGGNDSLFGGAGHDSLFGAAGNDTLNGGAGVDVLHGGRGDDTLVGGADADFFIYGLNFDADQINGFEDDVDTLQLDDNLWGGGLTVAQVLATYATQTAANIVDFDFGGGDTLRIVQAGLTVNELQNDLTIV